MIRKSRIVLAVLLVAVFAGVAAAQGAKGTLVGKVVDADGRAIAGARVLAAGSEDLSATTDEKGNFRIEASPGEYRLQFEADGYSSASLREAVVVTSGRETRLKHKVELAATDDQSVVRGSAFNMDGLSLSGVRVVVERIPDDTGTPVSKFRAETRTDSMGIFAVRVPRGEGRYRLTATLDRHKPATVVVDVAGGEIVNAPALKLEPGSGS